MRRSILTMVAVALVASARPTEAQLSYGLQGALLTGIEDETLDGTFGIGPRVGFTLPAVPIGAVGQGVYYFPEGEGSYMTYGLSALVRLPLPVVSPYAIGGWQWRRSSANDQSETQSGAAIGVGVQVNFGVSLFLEGTMEFNDEPAPNADPDHSIVIQGGVLLGG
jgi:hypothetical protein